MISPSDEVFIELKTSCTRDEACAKLIGWLQGTVRRKYLYLDNQGQISSDQFVRAHSLEGSLLENLEQLRNRAAGDFYCANESDASEVMLDEKASAVCEWEELINRANGYLADFDDEIGKGDCSAIRRDQRATDEEGKNYFTISSVDAWARARYGISISPEYTVAANCEPSAVPLSSTTEEKKPARQKLREQEQAILAAVRSAEYDPKNLPQHKSGKPGVKREIRDSLRNHDLFQGNTTFDKAWERLRKDGYIAGGE